MQSCLGNSMDNGGTHSKNYNICHILGDHYECSLGQIYHFSLWDQDIIVESGDATEEQQYHNTMGYPDPINW